MDWAVLRDDADRLTAGAQETAEVHDALQYILQRVNKHAFIVRPQAAAKWSGPSADSDEIQLVDYPLGRKIDEQISYVTVPHFGGGHQPTMVYYADTLQSLMADLDSRKTTGWIVDLRGNTGGIAGQCLLASGRYSAKEFVDISWNRTAPMPFGGNTKKEAVIMGHFPCSPSLDGYLLPPLYPSTCP